MYNAILNKSIGMLIGVHAGDCLGVTLEFAGPRESANAHRDLLGGGPFNFKVGEGSDDTDLMIRLLESTKDGSFDTRKTIGAYVDWYNTCPPDIGNTTSAALDKYIIDDSLEPTACGLTEETSQGNGSIMRCAPLALIDIYEKDVVNQCKLTHAHPTCIECDVAYVSGLRHALNKSDATPESITEIILSKLSDSIGSEVEKIIHLPWDKLPNSGWCVHSLAASMWALMNTNSFEEGVMAVVNRGDDADTGGAVTGGLLGAFYGYSKIPLRWRNQLRSREKIINLIIENN